MDTSLSRHDVNSLRGLIVILVVLLPCLFLPSLRLHAHAQAVAAVRSWLALPTAEIILFGQAQVCKVFMEHVVGDNNGMGRNQHKQRVSCHSIPCTKPLTDTLAVPTMDCLFRRAAELARTDIVVFSNSDILFFDDLATSLATVAAHTRNFFLVGKRRDLNGFPRSDDEGSLGRMTADHASWIADIRLRADREARGHAREGIDYMAYPRSKSPVLPAFLAGRVQWDNWALLQAVTDPDIDTFEASDVVTAIHLNHGAAKASILQPQMT